jgi:hypothetical protein
MPGGNYVPESGMTLWAKIQPGINVYSDSGGSSTQSSDGGNVRYWEISDGSVPTSFQKIGGVAHPTLRLNVVNGHPVLRGVMDSAFSDDTGSGIVERGLVTAAAFTMFIVAKWNTANDTSALGTSGNNYFAEQRSIPEMAMYDSVNIPAKAGDFSGSFKIVTSMLALGTGLIGVNDTRTASLSSAAYNNIAAGQVLQVMSGLGSRFLNGDLAEFLIYSSALTETSRKNTERYLGQKYAITLPY